MLLLIRGFVNNIFTSCVGVRTAITSVYGSPPFGDIAVGCVRYRLTTNYAHNKSIEHVYSLVYTRPWTDA